MHASRLVVALAVAGSVLDARALDPACHKNHYILDECPSDALHQSIGKVEAVATDAQGSVYFSAPHVVLRLNPDGTLTRIAGGYEPGNDGDGGPAVFAHLYIPYDDYPEFRLSPWGTEYPYLFGGLVVDREGNLFIADAYNNRVRRVDRTGRIDTVAGTDGIWWPQGVGVDAAGNLYVSSIHPLYRLGSVTRVSPDGIVTPYVRGCAAPPEDTGLCQPGLIAVDDVGNVYAGDAGCRVRRAGPDGTVVTVAGNERRLPSWVHECQQWFDSGPALDAVIGYSNAVALDAFGNLYIADSSNHCIRKVDPGGNIDTIAGYCGWRGFAGDGGPARDARFAYPYGIAVDAAGNVYVADTENERVRRITPAGIVDTVAGNGGFTSKLLLPRD